MLFHIKVVQRRGWSYEQPAPFHKKERKNKTKTNKTNKQTNKQTNKKTIKIKTFMDRSAGKTKL